MKKLYFLIPFIIILFIACQSDFRQISTSVELSSLEKQAKPKTLPMAIQESKENQSQFQLHATEYCIDICQQSLDALHSGYQLTDKQQQYIFNNINLLAAQLLQQPQLAALLIPKLFDDENALNQSHQQAIELIIANLKDQQKIHIAQVLTDIGSPSNLQVSLELMSDAIINTQQGFEVFQKTLDMATDQRVLHKALNLVSRVTEQQQKIALLDNLTKVMDNSSHSHTYGVALMAKVAITSQPSLLYADVFEAIEHLDEQTKQYGLTAIEALLKQEKQHSNQTMNHSHNHHDYQPWRSDPELALALSIVAKDSSLPTQISNKARALIYEYF